MKVVILNTKEFNMLDSDFKKHVLSDSETTILCDMIGRTINDVHHIKLTMDTVLEEDLNE